MGGAMINNMINNRKTKTLRRLFLEDILSLRNCENYKSQHKVLDEYLAFYLNELGGLGGAW
jgi:hypothetical protein